jgi:hypothetical protein
VAHRLLVRGSWPGCCDHLWGSAHRWPCGLIGCLATVAAKSHGKVLMATSGRPAEVFIVNMLKHLLSAGLQLYICTLANHVDTDTRAAYGALYKSRWWNRQPHEPLRDGQHTRLPLGHARIGVAASVPIHLSDKSGCIDVKQYSP